MTSLTESIPATRALTPTDGVGRYAYYVLVMLTLVSTLNFVRPAAHVDTAGANQGGVPSL